jgi:hypothetical protein
MTYWTDANGLIHTRGYTLTMADAGALVDLYADEAWAAINSEDIDGWIAAMKLKIELDAVMRRALAKRIDRRSRGYAVHHIDGDVFNNELSNLRIVDTRENRRGKP